MTDNYSDLVLVADSSKLEKRGDPTLTNIRSPYAPYLLAVSPVPPPMKAASAKSPGGQHRFLQPLQTKQEEPQINRIP